MRHLLAALVVSAKLLNAVPTGRYLGSESHSTAPLHAYKGVFEDQDLQELWHSTPSSSPHSAPWMAASSPARMGHSAHSALSPAQHAAGQVGVHHLSPPDHHTCAPVVFGSDGASAHSELSWSLSDIEPLSPIRWDDPPLSFQHSLPQMPATNHADTGHSAPSIVVPAPKRLKKHHAATLPPPHLQTPTPVVVPESYQPSTHGGPTPSSRHLGSHEHVLASSTTASTAHAPQSLPNSHATRKKGQLARKWKKAGLTMTGEAKPLDVHASLDEISTKYGPDRQIRLRGSILKAAVASVADGCTSKSQYIKCVSEKYGNGLMDNHRIALGRIIKKDMKDRGTYSLRTWVRGSQRIDPHAKTAVHNMRNGKWFAKAAGAQRKQLWLNLPPTGRKEPPLEVGDVHKYQEGIKHLDLNQLSSGEYIKQAHQQIEQAPGRWHRSVPKKAMNRHLRSNKISKAKFAHFQEVYDNAVKSVCIVLERVTD